MVFEIGKYYKHTTGQKLAVIGGLDTTTYGSTLIAEDSTGELIPVGKEEASAVNYVEITHEEWMEDFS